MTQQLTKTHQSATNVLRAWFFEKNPEEALTDKNLTNPEDSCDFHNTFELADACYRQAYDHALILVRGHYYHAHVEPEETREPNKVADIILSKTGRILKASDEARLYLSILASSAPESESNDYAALKTTTRSGVLRARENWAKMAANFDV